MNSKSNGKDENADSGADSPAEALNPPGDEDNAVKSKPSKSASRSVASKQSSKKQKSGGAAAVKKPADKPDGPDETDSFIAEVTEELRRDRLFAMFRRYGPYAIGLIVLFVGAAAYNEYSKSQQIDAARRVGGELIAAARSDEPEAAFLSVAAETKDGAAAVANLYAAALKANAGDVAGAAAIYRGVGVNPNLPRRLRDLANLRAAMAEIDVADPNRLIERLAPLSVTGAPYESLALELQANAHLRLGDTDAARGVLQEAIAAPVATPRTRQRIAELLTALGGPLKAADEEAASASETEPDETGDAQ